MKKGFPYLGKKTKIYHTETVNELNDSLFKVSCDTPHKMEEILDRELSRLDIELDSYEISTFNSNKDFNPYKYYLEGIALVLKKKQPIISGKVLRGVIGWEKLMSNFIRPGRKLRKQSIIIEKSMKNVEIQTDVKEEVIEIRHNADISKFLSLPKSVKKIKISRLTAKLNEIYEKMKVLDIDVPSRSATPDMPEYELEELMRFSPQLKMKSKAFEEVKVLNKLMRGKLLIDKEVQANLMNDNGYVFSSLNIDTEISLVRKNRELEVALNENKTLIERIKKLSEGNSRKSEVNERIKIDEETEKIIKSQAIDSKSMEILKNKLEVLNAKYIKQQKKINALDSMLFNCKILWKAAEEKLNQISTAWEIQVGSCFNFKPVNMKKIAEELKGLKEADFNLLQSVEKQLNALDELVIEDKEKIEIIEKSEKIIEKINNKEKKFKVLKRAVKENEQEIESKDQIKQKNNKESRKKNRIAKIKDSDQIEKSSSSEEIENKVKFEKKLKNKEPLRYFDSVLTQELLDNSDINDSIRRPNPVNIKNKKKAKFNSLDFRLTTQEPSPETTKNSISKTQHFKKNSILPVSHRPSPSFKSETPTYEASSNLKSKIKHFSGFPKTLDTISASNYEELLLKSLPTDQALALKRFIDSLLSKTPQQVRYSANSIQESEEKKLNFSVNLEKNDSKYSIDKTMRKLMEKDEKIFDFIDGEEKEKPKEMLRKIFSIDELRCLPQAAKVKINQLIVGHDLNCDDICEHLKRVMAIKFKIFGIRYPVKTQLLKFESK